MPIVTFVDTKLTKVVGGEFQSRPGREEIGAQLVAACCEEAGWQVCYLVPDTDDVIEIERAIKMTGADVAVFFPYTYTAHIAEGVARRLSGQMPLIWGGYHVADRGMAQTLIDHRLADYVVLGRGEKVLSELLKKLECGKVAERIIRHQQKGEQEPFFLDQLPWAYREDRLLQNISQEPIPFSPPIDLEKEPKRLALVAGSIGCAARCDFCRSWLIAPAVIHRSPGNIVSEMEWLRQKFGPGIIFEITDPLFNADRDWLLALCAEMKRRGPFPTIVMPDFALDSEMVKAMKRAGIYLVMMGLEFANDELRVRRGKRNFSAAQAFQLCSEEGILTRAFFMLGRLGMTEADLAAEISRLESLPFRADQLRINFEVPFPGTAIAHRLKPGDVIAPQNQWTTEEIVYATGLSAGEWQARRREITWAYHFSARQEEHYNRQIQKFPVLKSVYESFLVRLQSQHSSKGGES